MAGSSEFREKQSRVNRFLNAHGYDGMLLGRVENFAWFTGGGDSHVSLAAEQGVGALLIRPDRNTLITSNVERARLLEEELAGLDFAEEVSLWVEDALPPVVSRLTSGQKVVSDIPLSGVTADPGGIAGLRSPLTPEEVARYRKLGAEVGQALGEACMAVQPGMTEHEVAAALAQEHFARGIAPIVVLIAADDRLAKYRHPIPTDHKVKRVVMLVVCGRRHGLIVSATRIVHFGPIPAELARKHEAVMAVDAAFIVNTRPGVRIGDIFRRGVKCYAAQGFAEEWKLHHQGGPTGYAARDYRATADVADVVQSPQAFAWNPSITGTKSEDTIIASDAECEILSLSPGIPTVEIQTEGQGVRRSAILVR